MSSLTPLRFRLIRLLSRDDEGATAVEYGLIIALIATIIVGAVTALGTQLNGIFGGVGL